MNAAPGNFEQIYADYRPKVQRYLARMVGELEAEDLTQEVFMRINQALPSFRGESRLSTWIYRIATHAALDRLRSPHYQAADLDFSPARQAANGEADLPDCNAWTGEPTPLVEPQVYRKEMNACIQDTIRQLPEIYRTALVLSEIENLSNAEIAEVLGITLEAVKMRLHRARELIRKELFENCPAYWVVDNEFIPEMKREAK